MNFKSYKVIFVKESQVENVVRKEVETWEK